MSEQCTSCAALREELARVTHERDAWYERANNPGRALLDVKQRRERQALDDAWSEGRLLDEWDVVATVVDAWLPTGPRGRLDDMIRAVLDELGATAFEDDEVLAMVTRSGREYGLSDEVIADLIASRTRRHA
jgi:hypothetical protein